MSVFGRRLCGFVAQIFITPVNRSRLPSVGPTCVYNVLVGRGFQTLSYRQISAKVPCYQRNFGTLNLISSTKPSSLTAQVTRNLGIIFCIARNASSTVIKKRTKRKTGSKVIMDEFGVRGYDHHHDEMTFPVVAYATCDELNLEDLKKGLLGQGLYKPTEWGEDLSLEDVVHATAKYSIGEEPREIFFFREGTVVFWNLPDLERFSVLKFMKPYQMQSYSETDVLQESEYMLYANTEDNSTRLTNKGRILISKYPSDQMEVILEKYTFSNAMALSVKLGIWESTLEHFVDSIAHITEELKHGKTIKLTREQVLQKAGELFALRHELNLNSDLLDTPDFYWERDRLETLYQKTINYLSINRRTSVMNEKLNQCFELIELILSHLNDKHHVRLEWLIIILIMIEVGFEILHFVERFELL